MSHTHEEHSHEDGHQHGTTEDWKSKWPLLTALSILLVMQILYFAFNISFKVLDPFIYGFALILAGYPVFDLAWRKAKRFDIFNEFVLMSVATIGAFVIGSYSEGVAVMVFYSIGEWFQESAVNKAKKSIKALLDIRPNQTTVLRNGKTLNIKSSDVLIGDIIQVKSGEKVSLDGILISEKATFNTAALTGESKPESKTKGMDVYAGMINLNTLAEIEVKAEFKDSKLSKILEMVQDATARKSQTQLFISRFAKVYTPIVFALAVLLIFIPYFFVADYVFKEWLYRGLVFLVISCPCALVVSIPLGYFGGIGLASKNGILFKGGNFLDVITKIDTVVMDKTGTLTKGVFEVQKVVTNNINEQELISLTAAIESKSTHPIAMAIVRYADKLNKSVLSVAQVEEIAGFGLKGIVNDKELLVGNSKLLQKMDIAYDTALDKITESAVVVAINKQYAGYFIVADEIKEDAQQTIKALQQLKIETVMLSGDKNSVVNNVASFLNIKQAFGNLLPEDKVKKLEEFKNNGNKVAFIGDGVNDAPVIALADVGIAMGGLGSDATIETADVVIQNDQPFKIVTAIKIGKITHQIVWQNIILALAVKILVLALGAGGVATLWEAVIADVGVALLAILNAVRIQKFKI